MKTIIIISIITFLSVLWSYSPKRKDYENWKSVKVKVYYDNGHSRILFVKRPEYATFSIGQSRGGNYMKTWEFCMPFSIVRCGVTLINGVQFFEYQK